MIFQTLQKWFKERVHREKGIVVVTVEDRIQNAILTKIDNLITAWVELAVRSMIASSGLDAASVPANSERGECIKITGSFGNVSEKTIHFMN